MISKAMSHHQSGNHLCHLCDVTPLLEPSVLKHILVKHWEWLHLDEELDCGTLRNMLNNLHPDVLPKFKNIFSCCRVHFCLVLCHALFIYLFIYLFVCLFVFGVHSCSLGFFDEL